MYAYVILAVVGAIMGSFAGASVWRLRARQLRHDIALGEKGFKKEFKMLQQLLGSPLQDRSRCLHCSHPLAWYDLIPLVSWLSTKGKCRYCHAGIGWFEPLIELGVAVYFVGSFALWSTPLTAPLDVASFVVWLIAGVLMAILFAYDYKWFLLPDGISAALAASGVAMVVLSAIRTEEYLTTALSAAGAVGALAGLYGLLHLVSQGRWVGFGDVKLGVGLGLLLVDWQLALVALFFANLIGTLIAVPLMAAKKLSRQAHIPFGPLLIAGTVLAWFFGWTALNWYLSLLGF